MQEAAPTQHSPMEDRKEDPLLQSTLLEGPRIQRSEGLDHVGDPVAAALSGGRHDLRLPDTVNVHDLRPVARDSASPGPEARDEASWAIDRFDRASEFSRGGLHESGDGLEPVGRRLQVKQPDFMADPRLGFRKLHGDLRRTAVGRIEGRNDVDDSHRSRGWA